MSGKDGPAFCNVVDNKKMRSVLDAVNNMASLPIDKYSLSTVRYIYEKYSVLGEIHPPTIVVCGNQAVGKTSLLEQISGFRGFRHLLLRPLTLRLRCAPNDCVSKWSGVMEYNNSKGNAVSYTLYGSYGNVQPGLATKDNIRNKKGISSKMVYLTIQTTDGPNLTLIDFPGNCVRQHNDLMKSFIERPENIIIVVLPCNTNIKSVECLSMVKEADPEFKRTFGVLTFPDKVNPDAVQTVIDMVNNNGAVHLARGFTLVKCCPQTQADSNQSMDHPLKEEADFFRQHSLYSSLQPRQYGTASLVNKLSIEIADRLKKSLDKHISTTNIEINKLDTVLHGLCYSKQKSTDDLHWNFCRRIEHGDSKGTTSPYTTPEEELSRMAEQEAAEFGRHVLQYIEVNENSDLCKIIYGVTSDRESEYFSSPGFTDLYQTLSVVVTRKFVPFVLPLAENMSKNLHTRVELMLKKTSDKMFGEYPETAENIMGPAREYVQENYRETQMLIGFFMDIEKCGWTQDSVLRDERHRRRQKVQKNFIPECDNNRKPKNIKNAVNMQQAQTTQTPEPTLFTINKSDRSEVADQLLELLRAYLSIAGRRIMDYIPLLIMQKQVRQLSYTLRYILPQISDRKANPSDILAVDNHNIISHMRKKLMERLNELKSTYDELSAL